MKTDTPLPRPSPMPWTRSKREHADWGAIDDADGLLVANLSVTRFEPKGWHLNESNWVDGKCIEPPQITANVAALEALMELRWRKGPPTEPGRYDCVTYESCNGRVAIDLINGMLIGDDDHYFRPCDIAWHFPIPELPGEGE